MATVSKPQAEGLGHSLLETILSEEGFHPDEPRSLEETGLPTSVVESLIMKFLLLSGMLSGRAIADRICLPFGVIEPVLKSFRSRQIAIHTGSAPLNDYNYQLTDQGRERASQAMKACAYTGPAPVVLRDYLVSVEAQSIRAESPRRDRLLKAFAGVSIDTQLFESLGPAINSGAGLFLYGAPGNGKSTLARRITMCFGQTVWAPYTIIEDGQFIKFFDAAYHEPIDAQQGGLLKDASQDRRWLKIRRPTVVVGGELTMDGLEIRYDARSNTSEAPLQLKSNCGCLLIDDFGRQRIEPAELLNRWIIPLENRIDYLTLGSGKKIQVPFEQLIIFSTNLDPSELADEAFLRRIPYKIEIGDPSPAEFHLLFEIYCREYGCEYRKSDVDYLISKHYTPQGRAMRRCHPRDLLGQIRNLCAYQGVPLELRPEYFDRAVASYFTVVKSNPS